MFYEFPVIDIIDDVLPAIEDCDEIIVADRGTHTIINYVVVTADTFPPIKVAGGSVKMRAERMKRNAIRRECRGLIFDNATGKIVRRPYHKFFNVGEREETLPGNVPLVGVPHTFFEKLDGSMIAPFIADGEVLFGTRMGVTDIADQAKIFAESKPKLLEYIQYQCESGYTPIFEWCSRQQKIVIDHPEDRLVLTAVRNNRTGEYESAERIFRAKEYVGDVVGTYQFDSILTNDDLTAIHTMPMNDVGEGTVVRFDNGHMVKIKTEEYVRIHKVKERCEEERHVVLDLLKGDFDDLISIVQDDERERLQKYATKFWAARSQFVKHLQQLVNTVPGMFENRKEFALSDQSEYSKAEIRAIFHFWDYHEFEGDGAVHYYDVDTQLVARYVDQTIILPNCGTRTKFGAMKQTTFPNISFDRI